MNDPKTQEVIAELARCFQTEEPVRGLLEDAGVPPEQILPWGKESATVYWRVVLREIGNGLVLRGGREALIQAALERLPGNEIFQRALSTAAVQSARHNLPFPALGDFFRGRADALEALDAQGAAAITQTQAVHGLGGVGKTRLAVEYAWRSLERFEHILFASASSPETFRGEVAALAIRPLGLVDAVEDEAAVFESVIRRLETGANWLLILDNADTPEAVAAVQKFLPRLTAGRVLITSRISDWPIGLREISLDVWPEDVARQYLLDTTEGRRRASEDDGEMALAIARLLDGLPLALEQSAAFIRVRRLSLARYLEIWEARRAEILAWRDEKMMHHYPKPLATTWAVTFDELSIAARAVLRITSLLAPEPIPDGAFQTGAEHVTTATALLAEEIGGEAGDVDLDAALAELASFSLAKLGDEGLRVHRLVQEIVNGRIPEDRRRDWIEAALGMVNAAFDGDPGDVRTWPVLDPLRPHAERIAETADAAGIAEPTAWLINQLGVLLQGKGLWSLTEKWSRRALAIDTASYGENHPVVGRDLNNLAQLLQATNRMEEAEPLMRRALEIDEASYGENHPQVAVSLNNLAQLLKATNRLEEAEPLMRRALEIWEASLAPDHPWVIGGRANLAAIQAALKS